MRGNRKISGARDLASRRQILAVAFAIGVSSITTQLAVLREMWGAFGGNELVMGVVLGNWLLLMGLGAGSARWVESWISGSFLAHGQSDRRRSYRARALSWKRWLGGSLAPPEPTSTELLSQSDLPSPPLRAPSPVRQESVGVRGSGTWVAWRDSSLAVFAGLLIFTALVPFGQIAVLRGFRGWFGLEGMAMGIWATVWGSFLLLLPYCLSAGLLLALACTAMGGADPSHAAGWVYAMDAIGSVVGGLVFSFVLVRWLDHLALLGVPALMSLLVAIWITLTGRSSDAGTWRVTHEPTLTPALSHPTGEGVSAEVRRPLSSAVAPVLLVLELSALAGIAWLWLFRADTVTTAWQWPGQRLVYRGSSPYGRLVVTESEGQTNIIENGLLLASIPNVAEAEETVHFAMAQRPGAARVLLIGGALGGAPEEILRYPVAEVHCVELDPLVFSLGRELFAESMGAGQSAMPGDHEPGDTLSRPTGGGRAEGPGGQGRDARLQTFASDPRALVRQVDARYDVVILALPDPGTAQLNRLFTFEFFEELRSRMTPGGVLSFAVGRYENYASRELERLLSCARETAAAAFTHVLMLPSSRVWFLASDGPLTADIAPALEQAAVTTRWLNRHYLAATLTSDRLAGVERAGGGSAPVNRDLAPTLYYLQLRHWASQFAAGYGWLACGLAAAMGAVAWGFRGAGCVIFASGFAGAALEVVLLLGVQILVGSLYQQVSLVVTLFMAGLAVGAWIVMRLVAGRPRSKVVLLVLTALVTAFALSLPLALAGLASVAGGRFGGSAVEWTIGLLTFAFALVVGAQFPLANRLLPGTPTPAIRLYTVDFLGASGGALLTSTLLLPVIGVGGVCLVVAGLNALAGTVLWRTKGTG